MFSMRNFVKQGLLGAVGKQPDYWVILNAAGWAEKGVLFEEDLAEIQEAIDRHNAEEAARAEEERAIAAAAAAAAAAREEDESSGDFVEDEPLEPDGAGMEP